MRYTLALAAALWVGGFSTHAFAVTSYVLMNSDLTLNSSTDNGMVIGNRNAANLTITESNGRCGYKPDGLGGFQDDANYFNTGNSAFALIVATDSTRPGRIPQRMFWRTTDPPAIGLRFDTITDANSSTETCTETLNATTFTFKKYRVNEL